MGGQGERKAHFGITRLRENGGKKGAKARHSARPLHSLFHAVMPWCTQTIMCQCTLISDVHYHIIIPYVHFHSLVSPGSPSHGVTQPLSPWGDKPSLAQLRGAPVLSSALAGPTGTLLWPSHTAPGAGHDFTTPCSTAGAQNREPKPFLPMQIKACAQKAGTLSYPELKTTVIAGGTRVK